jgi:carboxypeptidase T
MFAQKLNGAQKLRCAFALAISVAASALHAHELNGAADALAHDDSVFQTKVLDPITANYVRENFDVWLYRPSSGHMDVRLNSAQLAELKALGLSFEANATMSAGLRQSLQKSTPQAAGIPNFPCYRTVEETAASLDALAARYPNLVSIRDIGDSYLKSIGTGGYDMRALVIENPAVVGNKAPFVLIGAIHAREYTTAETALRWVEALLARYQTDADARWLIDHRKIIVVPQMNPDGRKRAETGLSWRRNLRPTCASNANTTGVDLNRNSSYFWSVTGGASTNTCSDTYKGTGPASEPEVQAIEGLMATTFVDQRADGITAQAPESAEGVFISLHAYADMVLFPWGAYNSAAPNLEGLRTLARKMGHYTRYQVCQPPASGCLYAATGTTDDYAYGEYGVAGMTFEIGNQGFFESCSTFTDSSLPKMLPALDYALKAARRPFAEPRAPEVVNASAVRVGDSLRITAIADDARSFSGGQGTETIHTVMGANLYLTPPWLGAAPALTMTASDGAFDTSNEAIQIDVPLSMLGNSTLAWIIATDSTGPGVPTAVWLSASQFTDGFE